MLMTSIASAAINYGASRLVSQEEARHLGLTRPWFAQVQLDRSRNRVERAILKGDRLTVLTSAGAVQELSALTGETFWIASIGNPNYPSLGPTASEQFVALVNGATLYVLDRADGKPVISRRVGGAPGAAPALASKYVFVPLVNGRIEGYPLGEQTLTPWYYQSFGRAMVAPLTTKESIVWTTDQGNLYVGNCNELRVRFRLETHSDFVAPPAYRDPYVYVAAMSGEMFAMEEVTGARRWKYATGFPVTRAPAAVGDRVFVTSEEPMLHCVDAKTGAALWEAPDVSQFAAASKSRVYGVNSFGSLIVLDGATGKLLGRVTNENPVRALVNDQTDRIYLVSEDGIVQCLHEINAKEPFYHTPPPTKDEKADAARQQAAPQTEPGAPTEEDAAPAEEDAEKADAAEEPAEGKDFGVDDDPFKDFN
jgi:outer membrane protein assembly factor BamB